MKFIIIALSAFFIVQPAFSQPPTREQKTVQNPTQAQLQAQTKQARAEAIEEIKQMETDIADAKKNKEDPETIKEMEKNLAMMKKMLGIIDKVAIIDPQKKREIQTTNSVPSYRSPYIRFYKQAVVIPTKAQAKDRLLCYTGKKINQNTLITTTGRVIQYDRQNNQVLVQYNEKKDSTTLKIISNLARSRQWTNNYINNTAARKNSFFDYPLVMMAMKEFDLIEQDFNKLADNTVQLPGTGANPMAMNKPVYLNKNGVGGPNIFYETKLSYPPDLDEWARLAHQELMDLMNHAPPLDFPPPPKNEFDLCFYCDASLQEKHHKDMATWNDKFAEYEAKLISTGLAIERQYQLLGGNISESAISNLEQDIDKAAAFAFNRLNQKIDLLVQRYGKDVYRRESVIYNLLALARQQSLLGADADESKGQALQEKVSDLLNDKTFEEFIDQRIEAKDYNVIFNYALLLGNERVKQLLGASGGGEENNQLQKVQELNRFALTLTLDFEFEMVPEEGKPMLKANGSISTKDKIYLRLGRNNDCKWQFYLFDPDYSIMTTENAYKIPLIINSGTKMIKKPDGGWETYSYSGPKDLLMPFPSFRISFCPNSQQDSAFMETLRYEQENVSGDVSKAYKADFLAYANKMFLSIGKIGDNLSGLTDLADEMTNTASSQPTIDPTGYAKLDKMQGDFKVNGKQHDIQKQLTDLSKVEHTVLLFDAQNGSQFLINGTLNTANSEKVLDMKKGLIKLKVVLEPLNQ